MGRNRKRDDEWAEAKRLCRLSAGDLRMARELGLNPRKLIKNIPSPRQRWKAPVAEWVRELYRKRHGASFMERPRSSPLPRPPSLPAPPPDEPCEGELEETTGDNDASPEGAVFDDRGGAWPRRADDASWAEPDLSWEDDLAEQDRLLLRRHREFRAAADFVTVAFAGLPFVERVVLLGSVAQPLQREVPRFRRFRRAGVALWHECKDVDLAVWLSDVSDLKTLGKFRGHALNALLNEAGIGVAHHQVDVFLFEPGSDRYLGRLCHFGTCPKGKPECRVPGCGAAPFLRQHEDFVFDPRSLEPARCAVLFDRAGAVGPPSLERWEDELPF